MSLVSGGTAPHGSLSAVRLQNDVACGMQLFSFLSPLARQTLSRLDPPAVRIAALTIADRVRAMALDSAASEDSFSDKKVAAMGPQALVAAAQLLGILRIVDVHLVLEHSRQFIQNCFQLLAQYGRSPQFDGAPVVQRCALTDAVLTVTRLDRKPRRPDHVSQTSELMPMHFSQLKWFTWHVGRYLDGTLIDHGETDSGNVICLLRGDDGAAVKAFLSFPRLATMHNGCKVRILDPYLHVDGGGEVTLRIDCRSDLKILSCPDCLGASSIATRLVDAKTAGDTHLRAKSLDDALRVYMGALRDEVVPDDVSLVATLLNNMSQCYLNKGADHEALIAAAWVLFLRPDNAKAIGRYNAALARWTTAAGDDDRAALLTYCGRMPSLAPPTPVPRETPQTMTFDNRLRHKDEGNKQFSEQQWEAALCSYHAALQGYEEFGVLLSNLTLVLFESRQWIPILCVAPMAAFFNPNLREKNTHRYIFALLQLNCRDEAELLLKSADAAGDIHQRAANVIREKYERVVPGVNAAHQDCIAPLTLQHIHGKGRGLVATQDIQAGDVVLLEHALGSWSGRDDDPHAVRELPPTSPGGKTRLGIEHCHYGRRLLLPSEQHTFRLLEQRAATLPFPSTLLRALYLLCDEDPSSQALVGGQPLDIAAYMNGWRQRPFANPYPELSVDMGRICEIIVVNTFATNERALDKKSDGLFAIASLMNHDTNCNTFRESVDDRMIVRAVRRIAKGEEVTTKYYSLERCILEPDISTHWNIPPSAFQDASTQALVVRLVQHVHGQLNTRRLQSEEVAQLLHLFGEIHNNPTIPVPWKNNLLGTVLCVLAAHISLEQLPETPLYVAFVETTGVCLCDESLRVMKSLVAHWRRTNVVMKPGGLLDRIARLVAIHVGNAI